MARARRARESQIRGGGYNPIGCNRRKIRRLRIEMVGFIEAAKRNILSFPRSVLVPMRNETGIQSFLV